MLLQSFVIPIIKVTDRCNFLCKFCYYAQKTHQGNQISVDLCKKIIRYTFEYNIRNNNKRMRVIFHGGEPLLQPIEFYQDVLNYEKELTAEVETFEFLHSIQTNGYLINSQWVEFFKENSFNVGVSIDGSEEYNCHIGKKGVTESTETVLKHIRMLQEAGISYGVISVITNKHTRSAQDFYDFCKNNNIHDISLNYCYNENSHDSVDNSRLIPFVLQLFDLYYNGGYELNVREFNEIIAKCLGYCTDTCATCDRKNCGQYLSIDSHGNIYFCDTGYDKTTAIGNINEQSLYEIIDSNVYLNALLQCRMVYDNVCKKCDVREFCGGACHRHDVLSNGQYIANYFCPTNKALCKYIKDKLGEV